MANEKGLKLKEKITICVDYKKISLFETEGRKLIITSTLRDEIKISKVYHTSIFF
jgi:hypothetical protein